MVWQAGHLLNNGKYEILEVLGRGGFGLTYKARNQDLDMEVVIKTPDILQKRDIEYEEYVKQFQAEGRKLAKFSETTHPHIVRVLYFFTEDQVPCLVMDFIQGQTLMEKVKAQGKLSEAECLKYIRQIGGALEAVHQAGMVHRDAHPGNIMIQPNGNAILIDFGIAKEIIPASSSSTNSGANFSFAPYEQIFEHLQSRDRALENITSNRQPSVDIYTLSATFYYAITGQKPMPAFDRKSNNRLLVSPKEINPNLSEHVNTGITLGMALEKGDRPQSMSDWLQQLELPLQIVNQEQLAIEKDTKSWTWVGSSLSDEEFLHLLQEEQEREATSCQNENVFGDLFLLEDNNIDALKIDLSKLVSDDELLEIISISESPPRVEPQYRQEKVNPLPSVKPQKEPEGVQQKQTVNPNSSQNSIQETLQNIPWVWLINVFLVYGISNFLFGVNSPPWWAVAVAVLASLAGSVNWDMMAMDASWTMILFVAIFMGWTVGAVGPWSGLLVVAWAVTVTGARGELLRYFSRFHSFLILAGTSLSGLGCGWLLSFLLHPKG